MCGQRFSRVAWRAAWLAACVSTALVSVGCKRDAKSRDDREPQKSSEVVRAARRAFDGAPPVIPHGAVGAGCTECHNQAGREVEGLGFAPPTPHGETPGLSVYSNCRQCHVAKRSDDTFVASDFGGLPQDLREGRRAFLGAPPVLPHPRFMRENCRACHTGRAAREAIRTTHPERVRCGQCHVEQRVTSTFSPAP